MQYASIILLSSLLFGVCYARTIMEPLNYEGFPQDMSRFHMDETRSMEHQREDQTDESQMMAMKEDVKNIQRTLTQNGANGIELNSDDKEMVYHQLHAKIAYVKLNGLERFSLSNHYISRDDDMMRAKIQFAIAKPTATAVLSIHNSQDENVPFQKINVNFDMEHLAAELGLEKRSDDSSMELRSIETYAHRLRPTNADQYEDEVKSFVDQKLSSHVQKYIEDGLKNFIRREIAAVMTRGVLPSTMNEKQNSRGKENKEEYFKMW